MRRQAVWFNTGIYNHDFVCRKFLVSFYAGSLSVMRVLWYVAESIGYPDAGKRNFFLFLFRLRTVRNSKFSASSLWQRTDRCLMPWRFWQALCSGAGRHLLGLRRFMQRKAVCPKSWLWGRKLRISNCSPESGQHFWKITEKRIAGTPDISYN